MTSPDSTSRSQQALQNLLAEPLAVVMVPTLRPMLPPVADLALWSPIAAAAAVLTEPLAQNQPLDDRTLRSLATLPLTAEWQCALAERLDTRNLAGWLVAAPGSPTPLRQSDPTSCQQIAAVLLARRGGVGQSPERRVATWSGVDLLNWLWWTAQDPDVAADQLPSQAQDGVLAPLITFRSVLALASLHSPDRRTEQLTRYLANRARDDHQRTLLNRWAECIGGAQVPDDAFSATLVRLLQLQQWAEAGRAVQQHAADIREPLLRMSWLVAAILLTARHRPSDVPGVLELAAECWRAASDAGVNGAAVRTWAVQLIASTASIDPDRARPIVDELMPGSTTALLCRVGKSRSAAEELARIIGHHVLVHDDTPAMVDAWADTEVLQAWAAACSGGNLDLAGHLASGLSPRWRSLLDAVAAELSDSVSPEVAPHIRELIRAGRWSDPGIGATLTPSAAFFNVFWQGVRLNPRGALAFVAPVLAPLTALPARPDDLPVSVHRAWLEEWLLTPDPLVADSAALTSWVLEGAATLGADTAWQIGRALALHRGERLVPLLTAMAGWPDPTIDAILRTAADAIAPPSCRPQILQLVLSRWAPTSDIAPDPRLVAMAVEVIELEPRHRNALHVAALAAESAQRWEDAVALWERLARLTNDTGRRAELYLRMARLLEDRLQNPNAALENVIVSFICAPWEPGSLAMLEKRYRAQRRFKDLASSYTAAAESLVERGDPHQASEVLARRAQVELQGLDAPDTAAATLVEAIRLNPSALNLMMLLEQHVAPRAGAHWIRLAREAAARPESTL